MNKNTIITAGTPLPLYYRFISSVIRAVYYPNCTLINRTASPTNGKPTLYLCSHRNSAFDGYLPLKIAPLSQALASIQLLNSPIMRLFFTGIPVIRKKDKERFSITAHSFENPIDAGVAHLKNGGDLSLFPEGSSEWGYKPLPYQRGAARIARTLLEENIEFNVVPLGLFYVMPDRFASHAEIYVGNPISIVSKLDDESDRNWEKRIHEQFSQELDAVSVNCQNEVMFQQAEQYAYQSLLNGQSYASAFLEYQQNPDPTRCHKTQSATNTVAWRWLGFCLMFVFLPILLAARFAASQADGRNTVSFFKILGGSLASLLWLPALLIFTLCWPTLLLPSLISAFIGYKIIQKNGRSL